MLSNQGPCKRDQAQAENLEAKQYTLGEMNYILFDSRGNLAYIVSIICFHPLIAIWLTDLKVYKCATSHSWLEPWVTSGSPIRPQL